MKVSISIRLNPLLIALIKSVLQNVPMIVAVLGRNITISMNTVASSSRRNRSMVFGGPDPRYATRSIATTAEKTATSTSDHTDRYRKNLFLHVISS